MLKKQIIIEIKYCTFDMINTLAFTITNAVPNINYPKTYTPGSLPDKVGEDNINIAKLLNTKA